jgi:molybdopterin/thiamine biosynthesis adenylyltransferase
LFLAYEAVLVPDEKVHFSSGGFVLDTAMLVEIVNGAIRAGDALVETHNHGGHRPRFSSLDRAELAEFIDYIHDSLPSRPYAATVWGDEEIYGEYFLDTAERGPLTSITTAGKQLMQLVSGSTPPASDSELFDRQLPWFTEAGQRQLGLLRVGIVGLGGTGAHVAQQLAYLGVRRFVLADDDDVDLTNLNRLVTAFRADIDTPKVITARRLIRSVAPDAEVVIAPEGLCSRKGFDLLKGIDVLIGCVDNDGARLVMNQIALAYQVPYFDLGVGIVVADDKVEQAGGRVAAVLPGGPCLACMNQIDINEARFFLDTPQDQARQVQEGYVQGADVKEPAVVSLNATVASLAVNELAIYLSGVREVARFLEYDLLGTAHEHLGQWVGPRVSRRRSGCYECSLAGIGDRVDLDRYLRNRAGTKIKLVGV